MSRWLEVLKTLASLAIVGAQGWCVWMAGRSWARRHYFWGRVMVLFGLMLARNVLTLPGRGLDLLFDGAITLAALSMMLDVRRYVLDQERALHCKDEALARLRTLTDAPGCPVTACPFHPAHEIFQELI